jgi:hypothetical protein
MGAARQSSTVIRAFVGLLQRFTGRDHTIPGPCRQHDVNFSTTELLAIRRPPTGHHIEVKVVAMRVIGFGAEYSAEGAAGFAVDAAQEFRRLRLA